jgi:DNA helicase II / ATP-dependent DNA helicase PcrA
MSSHVSPETPFYTGPVRWLTGAEKPEELDGFAVVSWPELVSGWIAEARTMGMARKSLDSAAQDWLDWLDQVDRLAVVDVEMKTVDDVADLLGFVVEPATWRGIELVIVAEGEIEDLDDEEFVEAEFGYPYSLERLRWRLRGIKFPREAPAALPGTDFVPDPTQEAAVSAGDGVVQIIAPAGSGKTTVLVERVRELRRRGVPAKAIACVTFNRAAKAEMAERLEAAGVGNVEAYTFHGLGRRILVDAGVLQPNVDIGQASLSQWRRLATIASKTEDGVWIEPAEAAEKLSEIKLGLMLTAAEYRVRAAAGDDQERKTMAALYEAYEEMQREREQIDFDDLVLKAVRLLRADEQVRGIWQTHFEYLLVDEYQDIEPAQELIVRIIAAPHDQLFCVGDEDQTLYAFRRAGVERIICLDGLYPGLRRISLGVNYRCPGKVVAASRTLIDLNRVRFPKQIDPAPGRGEDGTIALCAFERQAEDTGDTAKLLKSKQRGEVAVLARTTNTLRPLALACADLGVTIDGNPKLFTPTGARRALQQHLRLALYPREATAKLVYGVCQTPARSLNRGAGQAIAERLGEGRSLEEAFEEVKAPRRGGGTLPAPGPLLTLVADCATAREAVFVLRSEGGLDAWFEESDDLAGLDQFECEVLERAEADAADRTPEQYLADLEQQAEKLRAIRDEDDGIEFLTIHGAKGRQWPQVILVGCEEGTMPHAKALKVEPAEEARGEGMEGERRLAYVAFTRAKERLDLHFDRARPSLFLADAGIVPQTSREARQAPPPPRPPGHGTTERRGLGGLLRRRG